MKPLQDQAVLVTAGSSESGVGGGVVDAVAEAGGLVVINGRDGGKLDAAVARVVAAGGRAVGVRGDVSSAGDCERMIAEAVERVGTLHHLVNNAGVGLNRASHRAEPADFDRLFGVDVRGLWLMTRAWLNHRLDAQGRLTDASAASVVHISSVHAQRTIAGYALYAAAKGAVEAMTRGQAVEYGPVGVRVNCVAPGLVHSEQNLEALRKLSPDAGAWSQAVVDDYQAIPHPVMPIDVGRAVVFLLSQAGRGVTGQTLTVDHGGTLLLFARSFTRS